MEMAKKLVTSMSSVLLTLSLNMFTGAEAMTYTLIIECI